MTLGPILFVAVVVLGTSFLSGIFGMAGGMILMGALLVVLPVPAAMVLHGITQMASNGWRAVLWRAYINWVILIRYVIGSMVALAFFSLVRFVPDRALVLIILGAIPFIAVSVPDRFAPRADRHLGAESCGFASTALQLLSGVSGPFVEIFFVRTTMDRRVVVATKATCQVLTHLTKLVYFGGIIGTSTDLVGWYAMLLAMALAVAGTSLSRAILERLTDIQFRRWSQRLVMGVGAFYVLQGLAAYARG